MKISICINLDTRKQRDEFGGENLQGVCNEDFLTHGVANKIAFFDGFDKEVIVYVDEHLCLSKDAFNFLQLAADTLVIRKHTDEPSFNCWNYIKALQLCSGDIICHVDQDCNLFSSSKETVQELIDYLDTFDYVSYPSNCSPNAVHDESFNYRWVSTRFFICKRSVLNFPEIIKCLNDYEYFSETYKPSRILHWLEHILGLISGSSVYYPPIEMDKTMIFCWENYEKYILQRLNNQKYEEVKDWVNSKGGIFYPNQVRI